MSEGKNPQSSPVQQKLMEKLQKARPRPASPSDKGQSSTPTPVASKIPKPYFKTPDTPLAEPSASPVSTPSKSPTAGRQKGGKSKTPKAPASSTKPTSKNDEAAKPAPKQKAKANTAPPADPLASMSEEEKKVVEAEYETYQANGGYAGGDGSLTLHQFATAWKGSTEAEKTKAVLEAEASADSEHPTTPSVTADTSTPTQPATPAIPQTATMRQPSSSSPMDPTRRLTLYVEGYIGSRASLRKILSAEVTQACKEMGTAKSCEEAKQKVCTAIDELVAKNNVELAMTTAKPGVRGSLEVFKQRNNLIELEELREKIMDFNEERKV
ncbi:hypothetical protein KC345_g7715 [Hortaea werneckii]|nr:hypothetical protein KC345_g7715 [Hortaea werneckii]